MEYVEIARAESERGELVLRERRLDPADGWSGGESGASSALELRANGVFVMDTAETSSEIALATAALALVTDPRDVVIGGLGLGFTLEATLADPRVEHVTVVEIEEALIGWMRDGTIPHGRAMLADQRVKIVNADLAMAVAEARATYDLVLLDVDNGPGYLVHDSNGSLYEAPFVARCRALLNPGGVLAIWSATEAPALAATLAEVFGDVVETRCPVSLQDREEVYRLYAGRVAAPAV